jgi:hypothetical protein
VLLIRERARERRVARELERRDATIDLLTDDAAAL